MKAIFTGMNGTVAPYVCDEFVSHGIDVIAYDRNKVSTDDPDQIETFLLSVKPDILIHFALGSHEWTKILSTLFFKHGIKFVYISTVSVFSNHQFGPHDIYKIPEPDDDYGRYKKLCEDIVRETNKDAYTIRLGWQIGYNKEQNQMMAFLYQKMKEDGVIFASSKWYPSTSFLKDTAKGIYDIVSRLKPDLYHVQSNDTFTFYDIVKELTKIYPNLIVKESHDFVADHRMVDDRVSIKKLSDIFNKT